jgi:hypothetical protein
MQYMAASATGASDAASLNYLAEALRRFARSVELCDDYLRGYYGLKLVRSCSQYNYLTTATHDLLTGFPGNK